MILVGGQGWRSKKFVGLNKYSGNSYLGWDVSKSSYIYGQILVDLARCTYLPSCPTMHIICIFPFTGLIQDLRLYAP